MWRALLILLVPLTVLLAAPYLDLPNRLAQVNSWIESLGPWGAPAFVGLYILATVAALPVSVLAACAGVLFGAGPAFGILVVSAVSGATCAFALSRTIARESTRDWLEGNPRLAQFDRVLARRGPVVVALVRVVPFVPFGMMNYALGLTGVPASTYVLYTLVGVLPGSALNALGSAAVAEGIRSGQVPWLLVGGATLLALVAVMLGRYAYRVICGGA